MDDNEQTIFSEGETFSEFESLKPEPKPLAFTIDFNDGKKVDINRHKSLVERYQKRHKRGQSLSNIEDISGNSMSKKYHLSDHLPRKSSFQSEGYFSSDEKGDRSKNVSVNARRDMLLSFKNVMSDQMTQSFPSTILPSILSPEIELNDISSPELDLLSPISSNIQGADLPGPIDKLMIKNSSLNDIDVIDLYNENFVDGSEFDFEKSDAISDAGTYTLDNEQYSEEQKLRMSIDRDFKIEQMSGLEKTKKYITSLSTYGEQSNPVVCETLPSELEIAKNIQKMTLVESKQENQALSSGKINNFTLSTPYNRSNNCKSFIGLSPILSPTENLSFTEKKSKEKLMNNGELNDSLNNTFTKVIFPSDKSNGQGLDTLINKGNVISVTYSGAFQANKKTEPPLMRRLSLTKSEIHVEAYVDNKTIVEKTSQSTIQKYNKITIPKLSANIINIQNISIQSKDMDDKDSETDEPKVVSRNSYLRKIVNLPPPIGGKNSPTKIPSPLHTLSHPRSRNSLSSQNIDLSDSSIETESYLQPTQNYINSLEQRLSLDSDQDSDFDEKYRVALNNTSHSLLKQKTTHTRHNSLDDRSLKISNKLEHFLNKNLQQTIDQTFTNKFNQYSQNKITPKVQNSPNNSPIRRSSSFSTRNQINLTSKNSNLKESNISRSPLVSKNTSIQKSASSAYIKSDRMYAASNLPHEKIDRSQFGDTESSSEDDFQRNEQKKKDMANLTNTRYNRAFSLRRGRLESQPVGLKYPNTPEMRRKFQSDHSERAISVDRKSTKSFSDAQSRYQSNSKKVSAAIPKLDTISKNLPKSATAMSRTPANRSQVLSRTDSGRFSMRANKSPMVYLQKSAKKESGGKKSSGRSNSSLTSREVDFQNWKRRKSYDPMKAAAEGKKKELEKRQNVMTQSYNEENQIHDCDSSPSHSGSVHRSQSFHGTVAMMEHLSSEEEEEDEMTLSADEGFSPPKQSPCEPNSNLRTPCRENMLHY